VGIHLKFGVLVVQANSVMVWLSLFVENFFDDAGLG
jgi:hypothetical protein